MYPERHEITNVDASRGRFRSDKELPLAISLLNRILSYRRALMDVKCDNGVLAVVSLTSDKFLVDLENRDQRKTQSCKYFLIINVRRVLAVRAAFGFPEMGTSSNTIL
jgi:hypothetical protein